VISGLVSVFSKYSLADENLFSSSFEKLEYDLACFWTIRFTYYTIKGDTGFAVVATPQ